MSGQYFGQVGFGVYELNASARPAIASADTVRDLYREGRLSVAQALDVAKPSDHGHALHAGRVTVADLIAQGIDLRKAQVAYARATGNGAVSKARKASQRDNATPSAVEARLLASDASAAMVRAVAARKAKRAADKAGKAGKVYSAAEIAALNASLAR